MSAYRLPVKTDCETDGSFYSTMRRAVALAELGRDPEMLAECPEPGGLRGARQHHGGGGPAAVRGARLLLRHGVARDKVPQKPGAQKREVCPQILRLMPRTLSRTFPCVYLLVKM